MQKCLEEFKAGEGWRSPILKIYYVHIGWVGEGQVYFQPNNSKIVQQPQFSSRKEQYRRSEGLSKNMLV